jgi:hypothetical protein
LRSIAVALLLLCLADGRVLAQGVAWTGLGPSVNVKAFGAAGDVQAGTDGTIGVMGGNSTLTSAQTFSSVDVGKSLWIDTAPFPAPVLAVITVASGGSCLGGGALANYGTYNYNVYYRISYTKAAGTTEGSVSFEGFVPLPHGTGQCVMIASPTPSGFSGATNYNVYFASDAPAPWISNGHTYFINDKVLDTNGNIEIALNIGQSGTSITWNKQVGQQTLDNTGTISPITWRNEGPVVPGSGSGQEVLAANASSRLLKNGQNQG